MTGAGEPFLNALGAAVGAGERLILCAFPGDPYSAPPSAWKPRPWLPGRGVDLSPAMNAYVTVASFGRAADGSFRRRTETFAGGLALMVDDVGTRVEAEKVASMTPSAIVETSPQNFQYWYFLDEPCRDPALFDGLIRAFISGKLLGADPGMSGITRVGRIPGFVNGKTKYNGWRCELRELNERRYTPQALLQGFNLSINGQRFRREPLHSADALERNRAFSTVYKFLSQRRMLKRREPDPSGWTEMTCPWVHDHSQQVDNGAAIREPAPENDFYGAFRCFHGHCIDKGWRELTEWIAEQAAEELENAAHEHN